MADKIIVIIAEWPLADDAQLLRVVHLVVSDGNVGPTIPSGAWPRLMPVAFAAAYCGEASISAFRRKVGVLYPLPVTPKGSRKKWLRDDLDKTIQKMLTETQSLPAFDAASVL